ncbi:major facilitator superfamily domain-containing protein [Cadophora sp. MPI-SDFR-AT-0126]|nr:major facilitator superfamily domain-containing protein [Leotiomycetes sp. MPI-SDFR-AT-0126]
MAHELKVAILNEAILDLGMGKYQWWTFVLTGFGWFVDNFWMQAITLISPLVKREFVVKRIAFLTVGKYAGLVLGSTLWPVSADFIGRKPAFNITLILSSVSGIVGAGMPNFVAISTMCAFIGLATGGNQPVDSAIFLEFIPASHQYLLTMQSAFWSIGQSVAVLVGWPLVVNYSCPSSTPTGECFYLDNMGWRYCFWTFAAITLVMSLLRFLFPMAETPKFLLGKKQDRKVVAVLNKIAKFNGKSTWLTIEHFERIDAELAATGHDLPQETAEQAILRRKVEMFKFEKLAGLFSTPKMAYSTTLMILLWCMIGMAYPLYNSFIPIYLENRGVAASTTSLNETYRNYAIQAIYGIPASAIGGLTVDMKHIGRKGTGTVVCICTGLFLFLYTQAKSSAAVLGFSCAVAFFQNLVYGLLYSYTPELFPAPIRGTGNGLVALFNRLSGLCAPILAAYIGVETDAPIWISASLFVVAGFLFFLLPYEMRGRAAS